MLKPTIAFSDFAKLDFRIGQIVQVEEVEGSDNLQKLTIDLGQEIGIRTILAGIRAYYSSKELEGKAIMVLVNLESKKMLKEESQGMLIAADCEGKPILLIPESKVVPGTIVR
jgi:methionine--tRNA ligase beta chain